ncbi:sucrose-phosphate phosphatase [Phormidium sp. CLA17]|nr:sucrose-phosphate phosphatase [Leptolyngbya sp. Cla-17]
MAAFLFVTDLDHTLVGDDHAMVELNRHLDDHRQQHGTKIVYSTGRSLTSYRQLKAEKPLLDPDVLIVSVGTEIYLAGSDVPDLSWTEFLSVNWNREMVAAIASQFDLTPQPTSEQRPFKVSYFLTETIAVELLPKLQALLDAKGLDAQLVYSGSKDLDILPRRANKGKAMTFLREQLAIAPDRTVACGDSGNDLSMFCDRAERGIIVGNAMPELLTWHQANPSDHRYLAEKTCAGGILEGLHHFGFLP